MKKTILIALFAALATSASAVTLSWNTATAIKFDGANLKSDNGVTGYLVYLSSGSYAAEYTVKDSFAASSIGTVVSEKSGSNGMSKIASTWTFTAGETYDNGDALGLLLVYTSGADKWYNLSSAALTISGAAEADLSTATPATDPSTASFAFSYGKGTDGKLTSGGGWVQAVPEPSTAMLALAGLALLIKRRRA